MVQISTPWGDPLTGEWAPMRRFLSNYFGHLLLVTSASDLPVRTIRFCSVVFGATSSLAVLLSYTRFTVERDCV